MSEWPSPVGIMVRGPDKFASQGGVYHAARSTDGRSREHEGIDICTISGQPIVAPFTANFLRVADPYDDRKDASLFGVLLRNMGDPSIELKILYVDPLRTLVGRTVTKGTVIGRAQSLRKLYPGIIDHVHVEVWMHGQRIDPTPFFMDLAAQKPPMSIT